jgi:hypothetical protein
MVASAMGDPPKSKPCYRPNSPPHNDGEYGQPRSPRRPAAHPDQAWPSIPFHHPHEQALWTQVWDESVM